MKTAAPENQAIATSLIQDLRERTHSGMQATLDFAKCHATMMRQVAGDRLEIANAAKKLLEGGDDVVEGLLAKKATIDSAALDHTVACILQRALYLFNESVTKLEAAQEAQIASATQEAQEGVTQIPCLPRCPSASSNASQSLWCVQGHRDCTGQRSPGSAKEEAQMAEGGLVQLSQSHAARLSFYKQIDDLLKQRPSSAEASAVERDAIAMLQARETYGNLLGKSHEGLEAMKQMAFASYESRPDAYAVGIFLHHLSERAHAGWRDAKQAASDRVEVAKAGKKLLDEGEVAASELAAKKACLEAASIDREVFNRVQIAIALFENSATLLKRQLRGEEKQCQKNFAALAEEHEARTLLYRQISELIRVPVASAELSMEQWDALALLSLKESCDVLKLNASDGCHAKEGCHVKTKAAAACA